MSIGSAADQTPPEWLHLLPAGEVKTMDGRGPYRVANAAALLAGSLPAGGKLVVDENHATDLAAPKGLSAPAHAWIVELQSRADGIWGRVQWVDPAAGIWRRYRGLSPVIAHLKDGTVTAILRASLTNMPNITGLHSLHSKETNMSDRLNLCQVLNLPDDAADAAIRAGVERVIAKEPHKKTPSAVSMQAAQDLSNKALMHQKRMADAGVEVTWLDAVAAVRGGN